MRSLQTLLKGEHVIGLTNVSFARDCACRACSEGKLHEKKHPSRISSPPRGLWSSFTWISLGLPHMIVLAERSIACLFWMTTQDIHGFISSRRKVRLNKPSSSFPMKLNVNTTQRFWQLEVTTAPSSRTTPWINSLEMRG